MHTFLFCNIFVDIFHFVVFLRNNTREMYRRSPHLLTLAINLKYGEHREGLTMVLHMEEKEDTQLDSKILIYPINCTYV